MTCGTVALLPPSRSALVASFSSLCQSSGPVTKDIMKDQVNDPANDPVKDPVNAIKEETAVQKNGDVGLEEKKMRSSVESSESVKGHGNGKTVKAKPSILTAGARALAKHAPRSSSNWWGTIKGSEAQKNAMALQVSIINVNFITYFIDS